MRYFEIGIATSAVSTGEGGFVSDDSLMYAIPEEAEELLEPIMAPYGNSPLWYFDKINYGRPPAPWALVCLDREYAIAGHIAATRPDDAGIAFTPYNRVPRPLPPDYVPGVGVIVLRSKAGLESAASESLVFEKARDALCACSPQKSSLAILDPLPEGWLNRVIVGDRERWLSR